MLGVSLFFVVPLYRRGEKHRWFCFYGMMVFFSSAGSDFYETYTGAWWRPWWLIVWNAFTGIGIAGIVFWYIRIRGSFKAVVEEFNKPLSSFAPKKRQTSQVGHPVEFDKECIPSTPSPYKLIVVLCMLFLLVVAGLGLCLSGPGRGWMNRTFFAPKAINDSRIVLLTVPTEQRNQQLKAFYKTYHNKNGFYGLVSPKQTIEGDPLQIFLISNNGQTQVIIDYTHDRYSDRNYKQLNPLTIQLGYKDDKGNFIEGVSNLSQDSNYVLKIEFPDDTLYVK